MIFPQLQPSSSGACMFTSNTLHYLNNVSPITCVMSLALDANTCSNASPLDYTYHLHTLTLQNVNNPTIQNVYTPTIQNVYHISSTGIVSIITSRPPARLNTNGGQCSCINSVTSVKYYFLVSSQGLQSVLIDIYLTDSPLSICGAQYPFVFQSSYTFHLPSLAPVYIGGPGYLSLVQLNIAAALHPNGYLL